MEYLLKHYLSVWAFVRYWHWRFIVE